MDIILSFCVYLKNSYFRTHKFYEHATNDICWQRKASFYCTNDIHDAVGYKLSAIYDA